MLLDLRVMFSASLAAVLLLIGGFGLLATLRTVGKPSVAILASPEITGSIGARGEKSQSLTDEDKSARPAQSAAGPPQPVPEPARTVNVEKTEKAQAAQEAEEDKPKPRRVVAKPRVPAARQNMGANFQANNPFVFPFFAAQPNTGQ